MKKLSKVLVLVLSAIMVLAMSASVFAAGTGTITINVPQTEQPTTAETTYKIYKVFDADGNGTGISYKLVSGKTTAPAGFTVDTAGNVTYNGTSTTDELTADDIAAIAAYVANDTPVATVTAAAGAISVTSDPLPNGYYYITTSTGTAVTIDSTNPNVTVDDKNVIPKVVKSAGTQYDAASLEAIAAVGTDQAFTAQITKTHGAKNLVFEDTMTNMSYNGDVAITVSAGTAPTADQAKVEATANGFKVTFDNDYIAGLDDGTVITLNYTGKITSDALSTNPATNKATLTTGDGNKSNSEEVKVYNAKFTVTKNQPAKEGDEGAVKGKDGNWYKPLAGAGFVIANSEGKYYKLADDKKSITWVDSIDDATEYTSDATGAVPAFTGLANGTYTLIEKTVPAGYNKAADSTFTVKGDDYTTNNLEQASTVTNESGSVLPSTGGIGTTLFYVLGSLLVVGCGIVLVSRKRMEKNN